MQINAPVGVTVAIADGATGAFRASDASGGLVCRRAPANAQEPLPEQAVARQSEGAMTGHVGICGPP